MHRVTLILVLTMTVLLGSSGVCWSADYQKGVDAYDRGDYVTAWNELVPFARRGHAPSQNKIGELLHSGIEKAGIPKNYEDAAEWWTRAAEQGYAPAQNNLGNRDYNGDGVPQDYQTAVKWYTRAAERGYATAQNNLGLMYRNGQGVAQDYVRAHMWWNFAASNGDGDAAYRRRTVEGKMTPSQIEEAQKLARECGEKNYKGCGNSSSFFDSLFD